MYFVKTPLWLKKIYSAYTWDICTNEKKLYLTFDDGPHPVATPFVLNQLKAFNAKASFFCIGKNVKLYPEVYRDILKNGHAVGNHTYNHLNGWKTDTENYIANIEDANGCIDSLLFRPPYGRIKRKQGRILKGKGFNIIMWDVLSADFDITITPEKCYSIVKQKSISGSIIVFHDSEKAFKNLEYALPKTLAFFSEKGFSFENLNDGYKGPG